MWGPEIVGFGSYHYQYASGGEADWFQVRFPPRKQNLTLYIMAGFQKYNALLKKLGKHKTGKSCLYIKQLDDVDMDVLTQLIKDSVVDSAGHCNTLYYFTDLEGVVHGTVRTSWPFRDPEGGVVATLEKGRVAE